MTQPNSTVVISTWQLDQINPYHFCSEPTNMTSMSIQSPILSLGNGRLHRAFVDLPPTMTGEGLRIQERIVFFEVPYAIEPGPHLENLLALIWGVDTKYWCERAHIYNIDSVGDLLGKAFGPVATGELRLLETGAGGKVLPAVGLDRIHYARISDVDLYVPPRTAARLRELLDTVELLYVAEPKRQAPPK